MAGNNFCKDILNQLRANCGYPSDEPKPMQKLTPDGNFKGYQLFVNLNNGYRALVCVYLSADSSTIMLNGAVHSVERGKGNKPKTMKYINGTTIPSNTAIPMVYNMVCKYFNDCCALAQSIVGVGAPPRDVCKKVLEQIKIDCNSPCNVTKTMKKFGTDTYFGNNIVVPLNNGYCIVLDISTNEYQYAISGRVTTDRKTGGDKPLLIKDFDACFLPSNAGETAVYSTASSYFSQCYGVANHIAMQG